MLTEEERQEVDPISYFEQVKRSRRDGMHIGGSAESGGYLFLSA
ncbi:hypothetical protein [Variovorax paradoxus]